MENIQQHIDLVKEANKITNRRTLYAVGAGLIPFPILDAATLLGIQLSMIRSIAKLYGIEFRRHMVKSLIGSMIGSVGSVSLAKSIPGMGTVWGMASTAATGAAATYALGRVFTQHFDQGGTLLDFDPITSRAYFKKEYEAGRLYVAQLEPTEEDVIEEAVYEYEDSPTEKERLIEESKQLHAALLNLKQAVETLREQQAFEATDDSEPLPSNTKRTSKEDTTDFTIIEGVGSKIAAVLKAAGIHTMEDLANANARRLKRVLKEADGNFNLADPASWPKQAALAAAGKMEELKALQDELTGGRAKRK